MTSAQSGHGPQVSAAQVGAKVCLSEFLELGIAWPPLLWGEAERYGKARAFILHHCVPGAHELSVCQTTRWVGGAGLGLLPGKRSAQPDREQKGAPAPAANVFTEG